MKKTEILTCTVLTMLMTMPLMVFSASATSVPTFSVSSLSQLHIAVPAGTTFSGSISTSATLRFWVSAPNGAQIVNLGLIDAPTTFSFVAQQTGNYTLNFENDVPHSNPIQVDFSYKTNPELPGSNNSSGIPISYLAIAVIITIFGSILIILLIHRKNKKRVTP